MEFEENAWSNLPITKFSLPSLPPPKLNFAVSPVITPFDWGYSGRYCLIRGSIVTMYVPVLLGQPTGIGATVGQTKMPFRASGDRGFGENDRLLNSLKPSQFTK